MKNFDKLTYTKKILWRIRLLWLLMILMIVYAIIFGVRGGWNTKLLTDFAHRISDFIFFGSLIFIGCRIHQNKKLLQNRSLLKEQLLKELDERNQYLHDKSGGTVLDILLVLELFATMTATAFNNMPAFYTAFGILAASVLLKVLFYRLASRGC